MEHAGVQLARCEKACKIDVQTAVSVQLRKQDTLDQPRRIRHTEVCSCSNMIPGRANFHGLYSLEVTEHMYSSHSQNSWGKAMGKLA